MGMCVFGGGGGGGEVHIAFGAGVLASAVALV